MSDLQLSCLENIQSADMWNNTFFQPTGCSNMTYLTGIMTLMMMSKKLISWLALHSLSLRLAEQANKSHLCDEVATHGEPD